MVMQVPPGLDLEESKAASVIASTIVLFVLGSIGVALRFYARRKGGQDLWWDDYLVIFAWLPFTIICIANFLGVKYGAGRHILWVLQYHPDRLTLFLKYIYAVEILYSFVIGPIKCSICCLYIRLFGIHKWFWWYNCALMVTTVLWGFATTFGSVFQCKPIHKAWNGDRSMCLDLRLFLIGTNIPNIIIDFLILTAPMPIIWNLQLPTRKKILVIALLCLGASESAFSIVRVVELTSLGITDATWDYVTPIIWSTVEPSVGLLCACVPVMGALLPRSWMERVSTGQRSGGRYYPKRQSPWSSELGNVSRKKQFGRLGGSSNAADTSASYDDADADSQTGIRQTTVVSMRSEEVDAPPAPHVRLGR